MRSKNVFNPADYNLTANPSLRKTNAPWRFFGALVIAGLACFLAWHFLRGPVRVSRPTLEFSHDRVTAMAFATNETGNPVRLSLRIVLGRATLGQEDRPPRFVVLASRDIEVSIFARSVEQVRCEFFEPPQFGQLQAEVQILRRQ